LLRKIAPLGRAIMPTIRIELCRGSGGAEGRGAGKLTRPLSWASFNEVAGGSRLILDSQYSVFGVTRLGSQPKNHAP
jgi:hypothetical protein